MIDWRNACMKFVREEWIFACGCIAHALFSYVAYFFCRTLSYQCPVTAHSDSFLQQILSSSQLTSRDTPLCVLYQFLLKRSQLGAGTRLLPILLKFYHWIHDALSFLVTEETAIKLPIKDAIDIYLQHNFQAKTREEYIQMFEDLKGVCLARACSCKFVYVLNGPLGLLLEKYRDYSQVVKGLAVFSGDSSLKSVVGTDGIIFTSITKIVWFCLWIAHSSCFTVSDNDTFIDSWLQWVHWYCAVALFKWKIVSLFCKLGWWHSSHRGHSSNVQLWIIEGVMWWNLSLCATVHVCMHHHLLIA